MRRPIFYRRPKKRSPKRGKHKKRALAALILIVIIIALAGLLLNLVNHQVLPAVIAMEEYRVINRLSNAVDAAVSALAAEYGGKLDSGEFYRVTMDGNGNIQSLSADTLLINEVVAHLSRFIDKFLAEPEDDYLGVPLGSLLGIDWLANIGPEYRFSVMPAGAVIVKYETAFESAGINQINYRVWASVTAKMRVVNPIQEDEFQVSRDVALINTVFSGDIPDVYIN